MKITLKQLKERGCCFEYKKAFRNCFGTKANLNITNLKKFSRYLYIETLPIYNSTNHTYNWSLRNLSFLVGWKKQNLIYGTLYGKEYNFKKTTNIFLKILEFNQRVK